MTFNRALLVVVVFITSVNANIQAQTKNCQHPETLSEAGLSRESCEKIDSAHVDTYQSAMPTALYASELDRRKVVIAYGPDAQLIREISGFEKNLNYDIRKSKLNQPPYFDESIKVFKEKNKLIDGWLVAVDQIQYRASQGKTGYAMLCAAAFKNENLAISVSECFPFEDRARFYQRLRKLAGR